MALSRSGVRSPLAPPLCVLKLRVARQTWQASEAVQIFDIPRADLARTEKAGLFYAITISFIGHCPDDHNLNFHAQPARLGLSGACLTADSGGRCCRNLRLCRMHGPISTSSFPPVTRPICCRAACLRCWRRIIRAHGAFFWWTITAPTAPPTSRRISPRVKICRSV